MHVRSAQHATRHPTSAGQLLEGVIGKGVAFGRVVEEFRILKGPDIALLVGLHGEAAGNRQAGARYIRGRHRRGLSHVGNRKALPAPCREQFCPPSGAALTWIHVAGMTTSPAATSRRVMLDGCLCCTVHAACWPALTNVGIALVRCMQAGLKTARSAYQCCLPG